MRPHTLPEHSVITHEHQISNLNYFCCGGKQAVDAQADATVALDEEVAAWAKAAKAAQTPAGPKR